VKSSVVTSDEPVCGAEVPKEAFVRLMIRELIGICILEIRQAPQPAGSIPRRCCTYGSGKSFESCAHGTAQLQQSRSKEPTPVWLDSRRGQVVPRPPL